MFEKTSLVLIAGAIPCNACQEEKIHQFSNLPRDDHIETIII